MRIVEIFNSIALFLSPAIGARDRVVAIFKLEELYDSLSPVLSCHPFPLHLITHLAYPVKMGLSGERSGSLLYVSRGSGTWGPPIRVLAPPEVTVIDLLPSS